MSTAPKPSYRPHDGRRYYRELCNLLEYGTRSPLPHDKITCRNDSRKLANNTRLTRDHFGTLAVTLHATDILTANPAGIITLRTNGWDTVTTSDRLNSVLPDGYRYWCESSVPYIGRYDANKITTSRHKRYRYYFADGSYVTKSGCGTSYYPSRIRPGMTEPAREDFPQAPGETYWGGESYRAYRAAVDAATEYATRHEFDGWEVNEYRGGYTPIPFQDGICIARGGRIVPPHTLQDNGRQYARVDAASVPLYKVLLDPRDDDAPSVAGRAPYQHAYEWRRDRVARVTGDLVPCQNAIHLATREQLPTWCRYPGADTGLTIWRASASGPVFNTGDKLFTRSARVLFPYPEGIARALLGFPLPAEGYTRAQAWDVLEHAATKAGAAIGRQIARDSFPDMLPRDDWRRPGVDPSQVDAARAVLQGMDDGDPEILDGLPHLDLSGEWTDGLTPRQVLEDIPPVAAWDTLGGLEHVEETEPDACYELVTTYQEAADSAAYDAAETYLRRFVDEWEQEHPDDDASED